MRIFLVGHSCSGKDTVGQLLSEVTGEIWTSLSFSMALSEVCKLLESKPDRAASQLRGLSPYLGITTTGADLFNQFGGYIDPTDNHRTLIKVTLGTWARMLDKDIWVRPVLQYISNNPFENIVVSDVRLENEYVSLRQRGFISIAVKADEVIRESRRFQRDGVNELPHGKSEEEINFLMTQCDYEVINNTSRACLKKQLATIVNQLLRQDGGNHRLR